MTQNIKFNNHAFGHTIQELLTAFDNSLFQLFIEIIESQNYHVSTQKRASDIIKLASKIVCDEAREWNEEAKIRVIKGMVEAGFISLLHSIYSRIF